MPVKKLSYMKDIEILENAGDNLGLWILHGYMSWRRLLMKEYSRLNIILTAISIKPWKNIFVLYVISFSKHVLVSLDS